MRGGGKLSQVLEIDCQHVALRVSAKSKTVDRTRGYDDESRPIEIKFPNGAWKFTALSYVNDFVLPNFYFHASMVYALLRKSGVEIGKGDFLGAIQ